MTLEKLEYRANPKPSPGELFYEDRLDIWFLTNTTINNYVLGLIQKQMLDDVCKELEIKTNHYYITGKELWKYAR